MLFCKARAAIPSHNTYMVKWENYPQMLFCQRQRPKSDTGIPTN